MKELKVLLFLLTQILFISKTDALPRYALKLGDNCASCHVNPTGGNMRNLNGWHFGKNLLGMYTPHDKKFKLSPQLNENISFGLDYRTQFLYSQEKEKTDFQEMTGSIYADVGIGEKINVFARYDFINFIWEGYAVAKILPNDGYIKVGTFQPNYGIRLDDHTAYTRGGDFFLLFTQGARQGLLYDPFYRETGIEFGLNFAGISNFTFSAGKNSANTSFRADPTYTARLEFTPRIGELGILLGASSVITHLPRRSNLIGGFFGIGFGDFALLAQYDVAEDLRAIDTKSNFMMTQASYQIMGGLEAIVRYDKIDPDNAVEKDEISRLVVGFEFFPYSFIEIRPQYRFIFEDEGVDNNSAVIQLHFWY